MEQMQYEKFTMMSPEENVGSNEEFKLSLTGLNH